MSEYQTWFREDRLPHIYCTGCGNGTVINCTIDAIKSLGWEIDGTTFISGIGNRNRMLWSLQVTGISQQLAGTTSSMPAGEISI